MPPLRLQIYFAATIVIVGSVIALALSPLPESNYSRAKATVTKSKASVAPRAFTPEPVYTTRCVTVPSTNLGARLQLDRSNSAKREVMGIDPSQPGNFVTIDGVRLEIVECVFTGKDEPDLIVDFAPAAHVERTDDSEEEAFRAKWGGPALDRFRQAAARGKTSPLDSWVKIHD